MLFYSLSDVFCLPYVSFWLFIRKRIDIFEKDIESRLLKVYSLTYLSFREQRAWYYVHLAGLILHRHSSDALWISIYKMSQYDAAFCHN